MKVDHCNECFCTGEADNPSKVAGLPGPFFTGKILNRYNYRFYGPQRKKIQNDLKEKRKNGTDEAEISAEKKKRCRLPEVYCVNKKKWFSVASASEVIGPLELIPGASNEDMHRILQFKLR